MTFSTFSKFATAGAFALALAVMAPDAALAQSSSGSSTGTRGAGARLDYLTGYLSLTDAQVTQAKAIFDAEDSATTTARGTLDTAQTALTTAIKASAADGELDRLSAAIGTIQGQIAAIHAKATVKFVAILTQTQKDKYFARQDRGGFRPFGRPGRGPAAE